VNDLAERIARLTDAQRRILAARLGLTAADATPAAGDIDDDIDDAVAVIGMGCRLPGGIDSPESFWDALCAGRDLISETPADRWAADEWVDADPATPGTTNSRWGGYLDDIAGFDRRYFRISADEAARMDPQQRLLLETAFDALADACVPPASLAGTDTGVYMASMTDDYTWLQTVDPALVTVHTGTGTQRSILANRLSYELDLRGPSIAMDTACSSSLAAVHLACQSIRTGESGIALVGGVNVMASPVTTVIYAKLGMLAPDGRCKTFDAAANGFVRAEGAGVVVLKRLSAALRDGDPIWAVVRGTAIGQDGRTSSITAPSGPAQTSVIRRALAQARVTPEQVGLVETHGTGTALGDPLELEALATALAGGRRCLLGAVKTNLGHLEAAAGVVGLIKTALSLHHRLVPPVLHQRDLNPRIDLAGTPFVIPTAPSPLPDGYAGVSSFGFGGSLAHAVLAPAPPVPASVPAAGPRLVVVTARARAALTELAGAYADRLASGDVTLADLAHTTVRRGDPHPFRAAVVSDTAADAATALRVVTPVRAFDDPGVAFVFPGQGAAGAAKELYAEDPAFRAAVAECDAEFRAAMGWSPVGALTGGEVGDTRHAQAARFTLQVGLAAVWRSWGLRPVAVIGQSLGEVAAAYVSGALSLPDAVRVVVARAALMARVDGPGASAVVELPAADAGGLGLAVAGVLSPTTTLLSGPVDVVRRVVADLAADGVFTQELRDVRVAFHSPEVAGLAPELATALAGLTPSSPEIPFVSTVTGAEETRLDGAYWARNLAAPFDLPAAVRAVRGVRCYVEVSPHPSLRRAIVGVDGEAVVVGSLTRAEPDRRALLTAAGTLLAAGVALDPAALVPDGRPVRLPGYPWQREEAWLPARPVRRMTGAPTPEIEATTRATETTAGTTTRTPAIEEPAIEGPTAGVVGAEPGDELEEVLRELWADALAVEPELIGRDTNFFQLGGNSLKGFGLVRQISERLDVRIPMDQVADLLTVRELADHIRALQAPVPEAAPPAPEEPPRAVDDTPPASADRFEPFPLLPIQRAYWVGQSMALGGVPARHYLEYETDADIDRLEAAWNRLIRRHEMLRAVVDPDGQQRILPEVPHYSIERTDIADDDQLTQLRARFTDPGRGTAEWPLFDVHATRHPDGTTRLHLAVDMVACDGRSFAILSDEWQLLHREPHATLAPIRLSFRDVVLDHRTADRSAADEYWRPKLPELPPPPQLPLAHDPDALGRPTFTRRGARLDRDRWQRLLAATAEAGISPSALLLAAYAEVLGTWSSSPEFCVNVTTFTLRTVHPDANSIVGDFTSNVPVAVDTTSAPTFRDRAKAVQRRLWSDVQHVGRSGVELVAEAGALRGDDAFRLGVPYVFTSLLAGDESARGTVPFGWFGTRVHSVAQTPQVLVDLQVMADRGELVLDVDTIDEMFPPGLTDVLVDALVGLVRELADDAGAWDRPPLSLIPAGQLTARRQANRTDAPVPGGGLHEPFVRVARAEPDRVAVRTSARTLTYGELDRASEHVADRLVETGVRRGDLVAVSMRKGWEQVVAVLGVLKAGAAYVPVDPDLPLARRRHLLARTRTAAVLTQPGLPVDGVAVDGTEAELRERPGPSGGDVAYVIFTSGSTGEPKGVVIHHRAALNTVADVNARFAVGPGDAVLGLSALSFDLSVYDVFGVLAAGATLVLPDADRAHDAEHWAELVTRHGVTVWNSVPALYGMYVDHLARAGLPAPGLRDVLLSGDWIPLTLPKRSRAVAPDTALTSLGGATEAAIWSISHPIGELDPSWPSIPYGRPLTNQRFHVVNAAGAHCPDWVPGELRIAGVGVALGYHDDEERTRASFPVDRRTGERQYRTGDLGRYRPDGTIEFLGRADSQVKVQGHRIEPGEIEAALATLPGVTDAAVVVLGARDANRTLVAHVVADGLTARDVRAHLAARLPAYMVPPTTTFWPTLPLTGNGKVDRTRLVAAGAGERRETEHTDAEPTTAVERALAAIWCDVLGRTRIGVHERFFELGGDSVLSIQVVSRAARAGLRITPRDLFEHQTVAELAGAARLDGPPAAPRPLEGSVPLLPIQRWLLELDLAEPEHFAQTLLLEPVDGPLDADRLTAALAAAFDRHDVFRLRFRRTAVAWSQYYTDETGAVVERLRVPDGSAWRDHVRVATERSRAFDLTDGPLARAVVFMTGDGAAALLVTAHHLVVDGVSWQVLLDDVAAAYAGASLPPVGTGFGAYANALAEHADGPDLAGQAVAWAERLADVDPAAPAGPERQAVAVTRSLDETTTADLITRAGSAYRTGVDELLLTALARTIRMPGGSPLRVDVEGHGRAVPGLPDVSGTVGWFTTITPVALAVDPDLDPGDAIVAVKETVRGLPGGAEVLHADWPRADIVLNYLGRLDGLGGGLLRIADGMAGRTSAPDNRRPWALEIDCRVLDGRFHLTWTYDSDRYTREAAEAAADRFVVELAGLVRHCAAPGAGRYTPADFPLAALTDEALTTVLDQFRRANARVRQDEEMRS
jgi:amino acid adenylation domain-containing protein/non-ribosomal peptide synthase protein (TIGR01720 family)